MKSIQKGNQWHSGNLLEQTWLKMTEHNCSLYPCWQGFFWVLWRSFSFNISPSSNRQKWGKLKITISIEPHKNRIVFSLFSISLFSNFFCCENQKVKEAVVTPEWKDQALRSQKRLRHAPVQSAGRVGLLSSHHVPTHRITKPKFTQQHRKKRVVIYPVPSQNNEIQTGTP